MGRESRVNEGRRMLVLEAVRGHESTVPHTFNHTGGQCPKCGAQQQNIVFCLPSSSLPHVTTCELEGEHLHRICAACGYPWIERCMDQAIFSEQRGEFRAESELAAILSVVVEKLDGVKLPSELVRSHKGWVIDLTRDAETGVVVLTTRQAPEELGAQHPKRPEDLPGAVS